MYMTTIQADALGLYAGRARAPGLLERASCFVIARGFPFVIASQISSPLKGED